MKKICSFCLALMLTLPLGVVAEAKEVQTSKITPETVITQDNIYEVLKYVGLDADAYVQQETNTADKVTVKQLQDAINIQKEAKPISHKTSVKSQLPDDNGGITTCSISDPPPGGITPRGCVTLYDTYDQGSYDLELHCSGEYYGSSWVRASDAGVSASVDLAVNDVSIDSKSLRLTWTSTYITLTYDVYTTLYVNVGIGKIKTASHHIYGTSNWGTKYI